MLDKILFLRMRINITMYCNRENRFIDSCEEIDGILFDGKPDYIVDFTEYYFCGKCEPEEEDGGMYDKVAEDCRRAV